MYLFFVRRAVRLPRNNQHVEVWEVASSVVDMSGNLSLTESASHMLKRALESGHWKLYHDASGRECYYNTLTHETTRDLRALLLTRYQVPASSFTSIDSRSAAIEESAADELNSLRQQLDTARATIRAYEREVTELRLAVFGPPKRTAEPDHDLAPISDLSSANVLKMMLNAAREVSTLLLHRVQQDRLRQGLCDNCLQRCAAPATAVESPSLLSAAMRSQGLGSNLLTRPDPMLVRATPLVQGLADSTLLDGSVSGYLPANLQPQFSPFSTLRAEQQERRPYAPLAVSPVAKSYTDASAVMVQGSTAPTAGSSSAPKSVPLSPPSAKSRNLERGYIPPALYEGIYGVSSRPAARGRGV